MEEPKDSNTNHLEAVPSGKYSSNRSVYTKSQLPNEDEQTMEQQDIENGQIDSTLASLYPTEITNGATAQKDIQMNDRAHVKEIVSIASPIILSEIFQNTLPIVDLVFVGNLGKEELAAAALATVWFNLWNTSMFGFMNAIDTMLAQSCGAAEWKSFSMWTGISLVATFLVSFVIVGAVSTCGPAMMLFGQQEELSALAGQFVLRLLPGMFPFYLFKVLTKYLQTQNILFPSVVIGVIANLVNVLVNYLLIHTFGLGLNGAPWATTLTRSIEFLMIVTYMYWKRNTTLKKSWPSFEMSNITWKVQRPFWKLGILGALSQSSDVWCFEVTTILAGLLGTTELDAHVITMSVATFIFMSVPFAIGIATSIRVGQLIGEMRSKDARRSFFVSMVFSVVIQVLFMIILVPSGSIIGRIFSNDKDVSALVARLIPIKGASLIGDAILANTVGACRGLGRFRLILALNTFGFWILAVPLGAIMTFVLNLSVAGLWWGFNIGIYASGILGVIALKYYVKWEKEAEKVMIRISTLKDDEKDANCSIQRN